ncbi:putative MFS family arabinose efflux permease [Motilibacter rhizosphaerae]|uniref:Putative MFS family arabinose efflux permease n=1 Tax=Motilibacter rhizosphaerae TaxID=598652 RepID=A0A4Q7NRX3_9ACTN|nr:MFS transporter [Motilibacter rhizosphaerae]RZS89821.1 putative MFS family arabinose efflux permease [Motilibacter rhizosphaerae]
MSAVGLKGYVEVLRHREALLPFVLSLLARLSYALVPLSAVLLVQQVRGSYGDAGLVTSTYGLGTAVGAPVLGRALDRVGHLRVLVPASLGCGALLLALALLAAADAPLGVLVALSTGAGVLFPPIGPAMREAWRQVFPDGPLRRGGYALDAVAVETIFIGGPLLLSVLVVTTPAAFPLAAAAVALAGGTTAFALTRASRSVEPHEDHADGTSRGQRSAALSPGMPLLLLAGFCLAVAFGSIDTSLAATARSVLHDQTKLGILFTAIAGGSTIGGLVYGARASHVPGQEQRRMPWTLATFSLGLLPLPFLLRLDPPPLLGVLPLLLLAGLSISPTILMQLNLIDRLCPPQQVNEGQSWHTTAVTTGAAAGAGLAGVLIDRIGVPASFADAVVATAVGALVAWLAQPLWRKEAL